MRTTGMLLPFAVDGEKLWRASMEKTMGRFARLIVAIEEEKAVGFAHGTVRFAPDFLSGVKVGFIHHVYVVSTVRSKGIGARMIQELEEWFREQDVHSYELQVLCENIPGIAFWEKLGYKKELLQMRKIN
jgi:GNAT superfamily N-acetyltransferase